MKRQTLITAIVGAFVASVMVAPAAEAVLKPDLVVKSGDFYRLIDVDEVTWALRGEEYKLTWEAKVKNIGAKGAIEPLVVLFAKRGGVWKPQDGVFAPKIPAGQARVIKVSFHKTYFPSSWPFGRYPLRICVDTTHEIAESNESNNCRKLTAPLYIIPGTFDGTVSGDYGPETWEGSVHLDLTEYGTEGLEAWFYYTVDEQSGLDYAASGSLHGCTYTGSGHVKPLHSAHLGDTLEMDFRTGKYDLYDLLPFVSTSTYPGTADCGNGPFEWFGPLSTGEWIRSGDDPRGFNNPGFTTLAGQFTVDIEPDVNYSWNLEPDVAP